MDSLTRRADRICLLAAKMTEVELVRRHLELDRSPREQAMDLLHEVETNPAKQAIVLANELTEEQIDAEVAQVVLLSSLIAARNIAADKEV